MVAKRCEFGVFVIFPSYNLALDEGVHRYFSSIQGSHKDVRLVSLAIQ